MQRLRARGIIAGRVPAPGRRGDTPGSAPGVLRYSLSRLLYPDPDGRYAAVLYAVRMFLLY